MIELWPPNYTEIFKSRQEAIGQMTANPSLIVGAKEYYGKERSHEFINDWGITYDPRNALQGIPTTLPFILFNRQKELTNFILSCLADQENGIIEKSRDMGATWLCCALTVYLWLFSPGISIGWGSRKEMLVDRLGDPDSIFEKIRMIIKHLPRWFWPKGYKPNEHSAFMKIINPETGATITGEAGDNIGRGGRKAIYFKDESAHYERPENIEAALTDTTNCQIDISSVRGTATIFHRRRAAGEIWDKDTVPTKGKTRVFIMDWREHPLKTQEWYDNRRNKAESEGLLHIFAQEVDRDSTAAVEGIVIPSMWVNAAIDAHLKLGIKVDGISVAGLDVADEGGDKNAIAIKKSVILEHTESWGEGDTGYTANKAISICSEKGVISLQYDCIGIGAGVKAETNRLRTEQLCPSSIEIVPWNAAANPLYPKKHIIEGDLQSMKNIDFYANLKAQAWWKLRLRFEKTYKAIIQGIQYAHEELISLPSTLRQLHQIKMELSQPTYKPDSRMRILIDKKPKGAKSPNLADAIIMAFWPIPPRRVAGPLT
jgi:hypothetical protein